MRILQVIPFFTPQMGGSPNVAYQTARHLAERGHQVTVATSDFGREAAWFPEGAFEVIAFPNLFAHWGFYVTPALISWVRENLSKYDIIHLHELRTFQNLTVRYFAERYDIPYVLSAHGTLPVIVQRKLAKHVYDLLFGRAILASASRLLAVSGVEAYQYRQVGIEEERTCIIYNGLDLNEFSSLPARGTFRNKIGLEAHHKVVLYLGRLHVRKGINYLIEAFVKLHAKEKDSILLIVGPDEGELAGLKTLTKKKGIQDKVRFLGPVYGGDKLAAYVDADVLAYPAIHEIFGLVPFEALLCGTPVVVADDCGLGQLINDAQAGYTVPYGDADNLASVIGRVLVNRAETERIVGEGQSFIRQNLDWGKIAAEVETLYQNVLNIRGIS